MGGYDIMIIGKKGGQPNDHATKKTGRIDLGLDGVGRVLEFMQDI